MSGWSKEDDQYQVLHIVTFKRMQANTTALSDALKLLFREHQLSLQLRRTSFGTFTRQR